VSTELSLVHIVRSPRPTQARPPLLVLLHGVGSNERDLFGFADMLDPRYLVISVRAPLDIGPDAFGWYHTSRTPGGPFNSQEETEASRLALIAFIDEAPNAYDTDPKQTYLLGFSQGAAMAMSVALTRPDLVAGVAMLSGRIPAEIRSRLAPSEALKGLLIFVGHGTFDEILPIQHARETRDLLSSMHVELVYREYPEPHTISYEELGDVVAWLSERLGTDSRVPIL
jgi:phospholipase/carboxylesterase